MGPGKRCRRQAVLSLHPAADRFSSFSSLFPVFTRKKLLTIVSWGAIIWDIVEKDCEEKSKSFTLLPESPGS